MANDEHGSDTIAEPESAHTSGRKSTRKQQVEVITRGERRRSWSVEQKREIAAESPHPYMAPIMVARRYGINTGQLYTWRRQLREGELGGSCQPPSQFARVAVLAEPAQPGSATASSTNGAGQPFRALLATDFVGTEILGSVEGDQYVPLELAEGVEAAGVIQFVHDRGEDQVQQLRLGRIQHGADVVVGGDPGQVEQVSLFDRP